MPRSIRYLEPQVRADLARKMVFIAGPRQVGKTTLARHFLNDEAGYLNWDIPEHRSHLLRGEMPPTSPWVLDEIHKYKNWRGLLKGLFDGRRPEQQILVTGSARLDLYLYGGDSLQGRHHLLRLHPLSVAELRIDSASGLHELLNLGGFPEPFFSGSEIEARRWSRQYRQLLVREEVTGLERVHDLGNMEMLMLRLPDMVSSPLSINALREDLQVSHKTVANWLDIFERLYALFRLAPLGGPTIRAVKKEQKHYHFDWSIVPGPGPRFENFVACHLLKWTHFLQDTEGRDIELRYFRDTDGREVDFVVSEPGRPHLCIECKWGDSDIDRGLRYLKGRFPQCQAWQVHAEGSKDYVSKEGIRVAPVLELLKTLV